MAWIATDEDGESWIFENKPIDDYWSSDYSESVLVPDCVALKLPGKPLDWEDEAVELLL